MATSDCKEEILIPGEVNPSVDTPVFRREILRILEEEASGEANPPDREIRVPEPFRVQVAAAASEDLARNAFRVGAHLEDSVENAPRFLAWARTRSGGTVLLEESVPASRSLREALLYHYHERPWCAPMMDLLQVCADAVKTLHLAGVEHRNLTVDHVRVLMDEQNAWSRAWCTGLEHSRIHPDPLPAPVRGRDNSRIELPSDLLRIFLEMQWAPEEVPTSFLREQRRTGFRRKAATSSVEASGGRWGCEEKDIWIWDDRSRQAIPALRSKEKRKYYRKRDLVPLVGVNLRYRGKIRREMRECRMSSWSRPVELNNRIGLGMNLEPDRFESERRWLEPLGPLPLLVRLYHHESKRNRQFAIDAIRTLHAEGHRLTVALVQDRQALLKPRSWRTFVEEAAGALSGFAEAFEVGHAINRVKWGIWNIPEYRQFLAPFQDWSLRYPQIPLLGPAGIDFEYPRVLPMLEQWRGVQRLSGFSHHLYVDRRGAPENHQNGYNLLDKLAYARAIARVHPACEEKVIVSEFNWPLQGTGVWSPVGSPYQSPGERTGDPSVDEDTVAAYLQRYVLPALCSGLADRVYWWNLAAHGFGLIDDRSEGGWRPRPAYHAFRDLVEIFRGSRFLDREKTADGWTYRFQRDGQPHQHHIRAS